MPPDGSGLGGRQMPIVVVLCLVWGALGWAFAPITIVVDGTPRAVANGATVGAVVERGLVLSAAGDVTGVRGGVVAAGAGGAPRVELDGRPAGSSVRVYPGAVLTSRRGADVREPIETTLVAIAPPVVDEGVGPDTTLASLGTPGLARVTRGQLSGDAIASAVLDAPVPSVVRHGPFPAGTPLIALTFDDGPWPGQTERVLDILKGEGVRATFFVVGVRVRIAPDLARREVREGHLLGNHTETHLMLRRIGPDGARLQVAQGVETIAAYTGERPRWFRAPGGIMTPEAAQTASDLGERVAGWSIDPADWRRPGAENIARRVVDHAQPGGVVLLHDGGGDRQQTVEALPGIIRSLKSAGYRFVTLDDL